MFQDYQDMQKYVNLENRRLPRILGRTIILMYDSKGEPLLTIGPHIAMSICLFVTITVLCSVFSVSMGPNDKILTALGVCIVLLHLSTFLATCLANPGIPCTVVTDQHVLGFLERKLQW
jgi:hypothetical protein